MRRFSEVNRQIDLWRGELLHEHLQGTCLGWFSGTGTLIIAAYGAIEEMELGPGEKFTIDPGHLVSFTEGIEFAVRKVGGWKSTLLSGEGLVVDLTRPGTSPCRPGARMRSWAG